MKHEPVPSGKRRTVELSLDETQVTDAEALGIDLALACDRALAAEVKRERERKWLEQNQEIIADWNAWFEKNGSPLDRFRAF